jgi:hypothetical protein
MVCEDVSFEVGTAIEFLYPAANYRRVRPRWERRRIRIDGVRRLADSPLDPLTLELEPELWRGETLVRGLDLDKGQERSFYVERMREVRSVAFSDTVLYRVVLV